MNRAWIYRVEGGEGQKKAGGCSRPGWLVGVADRYGGRCSRLVRKVGIAG
jgi:hypothetical protein